MRACIDVCGMVVVYMPLSLIPRMSGCTCIDVCGTRDHGCFPKEHALEYITRLMIFMYS